MNHQGDQRLSLEKLQAWEKLGYGMFIHFGMSTFDGAELSDGQAPPTLYAPDRLSVRQWLETASRAGMKYAVLTAKHVSGFCLWPSRYTDYHVGNSGCPADVVEIFLNECGRLGLMPGFYYCSWDNHHRFGSVTPSDAVPVEHPHRKAYLTGEYLDFEYRQVAELLTDYSGWGEIWIDIPSILPRHFRHRLYDLAGRLAPEAVVMMNNSFGDGEHYPYELAFPADIMAVERGLPRSAGQIKWRDIENRRYYLPAEVSDTIGMEWFFTENDPPRSDAELLGMYLVTRSRGANLLLNVPPDRTGVIRTEYADALLRLRQNLGRLGLPV